jgi:hypothetical protein
MHWRSAVGSATQLRHKVDDCGGQRWLFALGDGTERKREREKEKERNGWSAEERVKGRQSEREEAGQ